MNGRVAKALRRLPATEENPISRRSLRAIRSLRPTMAQVRMMHAQLLAGDKDAKS